MFDFASLPLPVNLAVFAVAALCVWLGGSTISRCADAINSRTHLGQAMLGLILLAGVTSLPELAVSITAAASGDTALAVNNILGSIAMQIALLALADGLIRHRALTASVPDPSVLLQGAFNVLILIVIAAGVVVGDTAFLGAGLWLWATLALFVYSMSVLSAAPRRETPWIANLGEEMEQEVENHRELAKQREQDRADESWPVLIAKTAAAGLTILVAGFIVARTGSAIAEQTGLGASFTGAILVAVATSLPEISTVVSTVRLGLYTMAISDILGTNLLNGMLLFAVDLVGGGEPALNQVGSFSAFGALLGAALTALYMIGLAERRDRTIGRLGIDSIAVLAVYAGGVAILYTLR